MATRSTQYEHPTPERVQVLGFKSPSQDLVFWEKVSMEWAETRNARYLDQHWDSATFPDHQLVFIEPIDSSGVWYRFYYAARREKQDDYNWDFQNGDTLIRSYVVERSEYPATPAPEDPDDRCFYSLPLLTEDATFEGYVFVGESPGRIDEVLDGRFVLVKRIYTKRYLISYKYDEDIERYVKITREPIVAGSYEPDLEATPTPGTLVEVQAQNNWIDIKVTSEVMWKDGDWSETEPPVLNISLTPIPVDANYKFHPRLDAVFLTWSTAAAFHASSQPAYDEAFYFEFFTTPPSPPPYRGTLSRTLTSDPSASVALTPTTKQIARQDSFGIVRSWTAATNKGNSARATAMKIEVPETVHGIIPLPSIANAGGSGTIYGEGGLGGPTGTDATAFYSAVELTATPYYDEFFALSDIVADVQTKRAKYNLYQVEIITIPLSGIYAEYVPPT